jgi:hypothetical protein
VPAPRLERHLVLHADSAETADGLQQWPGTAELIAQRLGPTALVVREEDREKLEAKLTELGVVLGGGG